MSSADLSSLI